MYRYDADSIFVTAWGFLFKRYLFDHLRFPLGKIGEDLSLIPRVIYGADRVAWIKKPLYGYRQRDGSITKRMYTIEIFDDIEALDECIDFFTRLQEPELIEAASFRRMSTLSFYTLIVRKYGFYYELPSSYKMNRIKAVMCLRKSCPRKLFLNYIYQIYPRYIRFEERLRRFLEIIGLRDPKNRWE